MKAEGVRKAWDKYKYVALVALVGALLLLWPEGGGSSKAAESGSSRQDVTAQLQDVEAEMDCGLEQLSAVMMDQEHIEIKAVIQLNLMAFLPQKIQNIEEITEEPLDMEELQNRPSLVGYIAKAGDDLWTIAKENHTTIQDILETNGWTEKNLQPGDAVLIVKQIG